MSTPPPPGFKNELEYVEASFGIKLNENDYNLNSEGQLTMLVLFGFGIMNITPIQKLNQLTRLDLTYNRITDIKPIEKLNKLTELFLSQNKITDIKPIEKLNALTLLDIYDNQITDIKPIENLKLLTYLNLSKNQIQDIKPIEHLKNLTELNLYNNQIQDIKPIENLKLLTYLNLSKNQIQDITPIKHLKKLTELNLYNNQIQDIKPIENLKNLTELNLFNNQIQDITPIEHLKNLTVLVLADNQIQDITPIEHLKNLTNLYLSDNQIQDIKPIENLKNLTELNLFNNQIQDITPIEHLRNLTELHLYNNQIQDITPIEHLKELEKLYLSYNQIQDITPIKHLKNLTVLHLSGNQIQDITPIEHLKKLTQLILSKNPIKNIPTNILNSSAQEIIRWLNENQKQPEHKKQPLKDIKVLLLGNTNIGKSNLLFLWQQQYKKLDGRKKYPEDSDSTHGLVYEVFSKTKDSTQLHIWDFGGQDYFHATHQLFFSPDALHVVLWAKQHTTRLEDETVFQLEYWLRCAEQLSKGTNTIETVLVENHIDSKTKNGIEYHTHFPESTQLSKFAVYSPHDTDDAKTATSDFVINTCSVSLLKKQRINGLFEILEERIDHIQRKNKHPKVYIDIRDQLANTNKKVWTLEEYYTETGETNDTILGPLHRAGCILYFHEQLPNIIFTKPEALLDLIYKDILNDDLQQVNGKITNEIKNAGNNNDLGLTAKDIETLLDAFNLIFKTRDKANKKITWYVPQYLPKAEPSWLELLKKYTFSFANVVITSDHYLMNNILLEIFQEYGTVIKQNEDDSYMFWQNGLIIEKDEQLLLVIYDRQNMTLQLYGDQQDNNLKLQKEVVDFVLKTTTPEEKNVMDYRHSEIKLDATLKSQTFDIPDKNKNKESDNWKSDIVDISVSKDGKYYININELYDNVESKMYTLKGYDYADNSNFKTFSVFSFNQYLADKDQGQMKTIAISYSKDDLTLVNEFIKNLVPLHDDGLIEDPWYCSQLEAGGEWNKEIQDKFKQADIIFFMVSPNFLATKYIKEHEIKTAIARREQEIADNVLPNRQLKIIPIILDFCRWDRKDDSYNLGKYTALPYIAKPVADFKNKNMAWYIIEECIRTAIEKDNDPEFNTSLNKAVQKIYERIIKGEVDDNN